MNFILKKLIRFSMRDFIALTKLDNPEFAEGLAKLKKKLPQNSAPPKSVKAKMDIKKRRVKGGLYYIVRDKNNRSNKKVLFIHGGGFFLEALPLHWRLCQRLARDTGCEIIFPEYPMVPESNAKECHIMLMEVYRELMKNSRPEDVTIIGDSAGGTLSLSLSMLARDRGLPLANEIILISPGFIIGEMNEKEQKRAEYIKKNDAILGLFPVSKISELWLGDLDVSEYRADATKGSIRELPHITMFSGTHDMMNIPARRFAAKMKKEGHPFTYFEKKGGAHDYALLKKSREEYDIMVSKIKG
ncbi:MAG: alpha/beta hydrolase fold domain-containing protein [Ruminococcus sp.]|uniref:alpha/beta hydrolase fold domain-containing protein n=1 Tax=Ruminococcus sp. TaxID=41978 RepID=UPI0025CDF5F1|nr:alpha/beta hydrolase fold domain-containing protein [Ruminococcus sp.]MBR5683907.1 alpha/beta hydrolase fold domain-containing protein [Ruminococcus sp.]